MSSHKTSFEEVLERIHCVIRSKTPQKYLERIPKEINIKIQEEGVS